METVMHVIWIIIFLCLGYLMTKFFDWLEDRRFEKSIREKETV